MEEPAEIPFKPEEIQTMADAISAVTPRGPRDRAMVLVCFGSGLRVSLLAKKDFSTLATPFFWHGANQRRSCLRAVQQMMGHTSIDTPKPTTGLVRPFPGL
jgi:site-specific recombinase XerC